MSVTPNRHGTQSCATQPGLERFHRRPAIWETQLGGGHGGKGNKSGSTANPLTNHRKLQVLGCGFRVVIVQFRGKTVVLHHNGTQKRSTGRTSRSGRLETGGIGNGMPHDRGSVSGPVPRLKEDPCRGGLDTEPNQPGKEPCLGRRPSGWLPMKLIPCD